MDHRPAARRTLRPRAVLALVALGLTPLSASPADAAPRRAAHPAPRAAPVTASAVCTAATARPATIAALTATAHASIGRCVAVEGIAVGRLLVADGSARYRPERVENDPSSNGAILGLEGEQSFAQPVHVRAIGRVRDCDAVPSAAPSAAPPATPAAPGGYCQYFKGLVLEPISITPGESAHFTRLTRAEAAPGLGNLLPLADSDVRRQMMGAARSFLTALRSGDGATLTAMHGGAPASATPGAAPAEGGHRDPADIQAMLRLTLADAQSPFASLRRSGTLLIEVFGWRDPQWADAAWQQERARQPAADAIACFSARPDAADLWPIDSKDADNRPGRPYACTRIHLAGVGEDAPASFDTAQAANGASEP